MIYLFLFLKIKLYIYFHHFWIAVSSLYLPIDNVSIFSFVENQLLYIIKDLFSAGVDTTNSTIGFIIAFLVVHQNVQSKVYDEISRVIDKDIYPSLSDKDR